MIGSIIKEGMNLDFPEGSGMIIILIKRMMIFILM